MGETNERVLTDTVTVVWGGAERVVEVANTGGRLVGKIGCVELSYHNPYDGWSATIDVDAEEITNNECAEVFVVGAGATAQAALDELASNMRGLAAWVNTMLNGSEVTP